MSKDQKTEQVQQIRKSLEVHDTQFLVNVWKTNNRREWTPEAFDAIHEILLERLGSIPAQKERDPREAMEPREKKQRLFLTHFDGEIEFQYLNAEDAHHILGHLRAALSAQHATDIHLSGNKVTFQVAIFRFVSNWNVLVPVDKGEIIVHSGTPGAVKYSFSFMRMFVSVTLMVILFFLLLLPNLRSNPLAVFAVPIIFWLFGFGLNYIVAIFRLKDFVWHVISQ
jgi:hypothetical protein